MKEERKEGRKRELEKERANEEKEGKKKGAHRIGVLDIGKLLHCVAS